MIVGSLGEIVFYVSDFDVFTLKKEITKIRKAKITKHNPIYGLTKIRFQGRELIQLKLSVQLISTLTPLPGARLSVIDSFIDSGKYAPLIIGVHVMGDFPFMMTECEEKLSYLNPTIGDFDCVDVELTLIEYVDDVNYYNNKMKKIINKEFSKITFGNKKEIILEQKKVMK